MARPNVADQLIEDVESLHLNNRGYPASSFQEALATVIEMAHPDTLEEKRLSVSSAYPNDSGLNIARLHPDTMAQLSLESGDLVQIQGETTTAATVREMDGPDASRGAVRIDGFTRENAAVDVGEYVVVRPIEATPASTVAFELAEGIATPGTGEQVKSAIEEQDFLRDRAVTVGDTVPIMANKGDPFGEPPGKAVPLLVTAVQPDGVARITDDTKLDVAWS